MVLHLFTSAQFVIDNSVVMAWCFQDVGNRYTQAILDSRESNEA